MGACVVRVCVCEREREECMREVCVCCREGECVCGWRGWCVCVCGACWGGEGVELCHRVVVIRLGASR